MAVMNDEADVKLAGAMGTLAHSKNSHVIENLKIAAGLSEGDFRVILSKTLMLING